MSGVGSTRPWKGPSDRSTWRERAILMRASRADLARPLGMESGMGLETAQRTGNQSFLDTFGPARPKVLVIGCGGAGGNSVHRLHRMGIHGARTVVVNTDAVHLDSIQADRKLLIGGGVTRGMGAGGRPEIGERCAEISEQELRNQIGDADLTFITVGLGGGTGTGVAPHVAELAQAAGSVVISLATTPFRAERGRMTNARAGIQRLRDRTDSLILLDNNRLLDLVPNLPVEQAFAVMDHLIGEVIKGITESITVPSLINLDFSDVRTILQSGGTRVRLDRGRGLGSRVPIIDSERVPSDESTTLIVTQVAVAAGP